MTFARPHRRLTAWIALVAMLAFALVPTLSRAMAFATGDSSWAQICTPQGMKQVSTSEGDHEPAQAGLPLEHCAFCAMAADGAAPLPAAVVTVQLPLHSAEPPRLFLQARAPQHAWRPAQARAPPAKV